MPNTDDFTGFPKEGLQFLADLAHNNNREWFNARKGVYLESVQGPAQAFVAALGRRLKRLSPGIAYDTNPNGGGSLLRIYRDVRFSRDKTPYNTDVRMSFWEGPAKKEALSSFFVGIGP